MTNDFFRDFDKEAPQSPVLTFSGAEEAAAGVEKEAAQPAPSKTAEDAMEEARKLLTPEELSQVDAFADKIDLSDSAAIMNYGASTQKKLADFSQSALDNVRAKDMGETGEMMTQLITQLRNFDVDNEEKKGLFGLFKKADNSLAAMKAKYSKVETNVTTISNELEKHQVMLLKDIDVLDRMYELNLNYFRELTMYILAGKKKLQAVRENDLPELQKKAEESGLAEDAQAARDLSAQCDRFEKKLYDLELTRTVSMQTAPQIRMVQTSDTVMAEKIQSTIVNTIPLWKNQMVISLGVEHAAQAARAEREVNDMTNELLKKNADALKTATVAAAKESERGIIDIETLRHTNETLISAMDEVIAVQKEGRQKRLAAENELAQIEDQLKNKLLEAARN